jgi:hypothetical protein
LQVVQMCVNAAQGQQFVVGTIFSHDTVGDGDDAVGVADGAQSVDDDDDGAALRAVRGLR